MNWIAIIIIALLFSAFFSGMEIAFVSSNKVRAELDMKQKGLLSRILSLFYGNEEQFISTMLVGNNIALVIYGMGMAALLEPVIALVWDQEAFVVLMQTLLSTLLILFVGEFMPKTIFRIDPNATMRFFAPLVWLIYVVLYPISKFTSMVSKWLMRLGGVKIEHHTDVLMSKIELDSFIQKSIEESDSKEPVEPEMKIFQNALDFSNLHLRDCMIPRTELVAVDIDEVTDEELLHTFVSTGISKVLVYRESIDNILGYIHSSEMFRQHDDWRKSIRPAVFAPESMLANKLMRNLMQQKKSLAIVVDEFGGTAGLVTLEDLVEEIFGDIEDEHDTQNLVARRVGENEYEFSGRMEIGRINEEFGLDIPESDDYQTIAGYILYHYQTLPRLGETVEIKNYRFTILRRKATKIELVRMKIEE
ncbi:hemolysin family protein [Barnesiella viscericola]|uniref:Hemolysin family protein n=1 Tax=Barnesiella viscericola TaxID=397865 RepID=A0A921SVW9_9BACT|nr:hemolysin family protein [Barnesiella viscericola]HJG89752.1 hemolysin family protein [Barnesiella viscericola]